MRRTSKIRKIDLTGSNLHWLRGQFIIHERRDIQWVELAQMLGISKRYMKYLVAGKRHCSVKMAQRIVNLCRERGIMVHLSDFYADLRSIQEREQT